MNGMLHVWVTGDAVSKAIVIVLAAMSLASWAVMLLKLWQGIRFRSQALAMQRGFWQPGGMRPPIEALGDADDSPFVELARAADLADAHPLDGRPGSSHRLNPSDWMSRCLRNVLDDVAARQQAGLPVLGTVGATAPFVGLLGTVWGIYHALLAIGGSSQPSLDQVAGPVGEALIMTAVGLFVALPAVLGYNAIHRSNRTAMRRVMRFANDLHDHYATGARLGAAPAATGATATIVSSSRPPGDAAAQAAVLVPRAR